jgi:hypothetical protein
MDPQDTRPTGWAKRHQMALTLLAFVLPMTFAADKALADHTVQERWIAYGYIYNDDPAGCLITYFNGDQTTPTTQTWELTLSISITRADGQACSSEAVGTTGVASGSVNKLQITLDSRLMSGTLIGEVPMTFDSDGSVVNFRVALQFSGITGTLSPLRFTVNPNPGAGNFHISSYSRQATVTGVLSDGFTNYAANAVLSSAGLQSIKTFINSPKPVLLR